MAVVKIAYTFWQVLTGDISILDGLKKIGLAVLGFLLTPFRWVNATAAEHQHHDEHLAGEIHTITDAGPERPQVAPRCPRPAST